MTSPPAEGQTNNRAWGLALLAAATFAVGISVYRAASPDGACEARAASIDETWNEARRSAVAQTFTASPLPYAPAMATRLTRRVDAWAEGWRQARLDTCVATQASPPAPPAQTAARVACLQDTRAELDALVDTLEDGEDTAIRLSIANVIALPSADICAAPLGEPPASALAPAVAERASHLHDEVRRARALANAGAFEPAMESAMEIATRADAYGITTVVIDAGLLQAQLRSGRGETLAAGSAWQNAFALAIRANEPRRALQAARALALTTAADPARAAGALAWIERGEALLQSEPTSQHAVEGDLRQARGLMALTQGRAHQALPILEQALATHIEAWGSEDLRLLPNLELLARAQAAAGLGGDAKQSQQRAIEIATEALGPNHPDIPTRDVQPHAE